MDGRRLWRGITHRARRTVRDRPSAAPRWRHLFAPCAFALALLACSPAQPVRLGFIATLAGRGADLGISGRNGAQLAVEMRNAAGGIGGQAVELLTRDDGNDPEHARLAFRGLVAEGVAAVVGPMTSSIAVVLAAEAERTRVLLISPTATSNELTGRDDHFFRVIAPTQAFAARSAEHLLAERGVRSLAVIYDARNAAYTSSWLGDFRRTFEAGGGRIASVLTFESGPEERFLPLARTLLAESTDGILMLANSLDAALIAQQVRKLDGKVVLAASEWAATERLTSLGGRAVEGIAIASFLDEDNTEPAFRDFQRAYRERFGNPPSFAALTAFDAAKAALDGLAKRAAGQPLRDYLKEHPQVAGLQGGFSFDAFGEASRQTFVSTIENGRFKRYAPAR